jgi:hypothetical protein
VSKEKKPKKDRKAKRLRWYRRGVIAHFGDHSGWARVAGGGHAWRVEEIDGAGRPVRTLGEFESCPPAKAALRKLRRAALG